MGYFYFDERDNTGEKSSYRGLLLSLLGQIALNNDGVHPLLHNLYKNCHSGNSLPETEDLKYILQCAATILRIFIIVDALDECSEGYLVMHFLQEMPRTCKILVTSRYNAQDANLWLNLWLDTKAVASDIDIYLKDKLNSRKWSEKLHGEVYNALVEGAQGQ